MYRTRLAAVMLAALAPVSWADTINVPSEFATIAEAVAAANAGDTIEIAAGTYFENDIVIDKPLTVRGQSMDDTIIDAQSLSRVFAVSVTGAFKIEGMTIQNGFDGPDGGGIRVNATTTEIDSVRFLNNMTTADAGAGFEVRGDSLIVRNSEFIGNSAAGIGGGAACYTTETDFVQCLFQGNQSANRAVALYASSVYTRVVNCTFVEHPLEGNGGSRLVDAVDGGVLEIRSCVFADNGANEVRSVNGGSGVISNSVLQPDLVLVEVDDEGNNVRADAEFRDAAGGDFGLAAGSPGIDMADLDSYLSFEPGLFDLGGRARLVNDPATSDTGLGQEAFLDAGAYEYQGLSCLADINDDGDVNTLDILDYLNRWNAGCP